MKKRLPLQSFRLQNFKAVRDSGVVKFTPLTVFVGNNGSGKSSLIEGLETFHNVVSFGLDKAMQQWRGFEQVWNHAMEHDLKRPVGQRASCSNPMIFQVEMNLDDLLQKARQEVNLGDDDRIYLEIEELSQQGDAHRLRRDAQGMAESFDGGPWTPLRPLSDGDSMLNRLCVVQLRRWQFLTLAPDAMGQPVPQQRAGHRIVLAKNGANIAEYLNDIRSSDADAFEGIIASLKQVLHYADDLSPVLTSELERLFYLKLKEESFEVPGWLLSTGTLRIVALLACLRHPDPPQVLIVEEIENGLDPRTLHLLVEEIRAAIATGKTQVLATTHSPYLLDLLDLSHIVVVERFDGGPTFKRPDRKELATWIKTFSPGRLYTMGRLTRGD